MDWKLISATGRMLVSHPCLIIINMTTGDRGSSSWNNLLDQCNSCSLPVFLHFNFARHKRIHEQSNQYTLIVQSPYNRSYTLIKQSIKLHAKLVLYLSNSNQISKSERLFLVTVKGIQQQISENMCAEIH